MISRIRAKADPQLSPQIYPHQRSNLLPPRRCPAFSATIRFMVRRKIYRQVNLLSNREKNGFPFLGEWINNAGRERSGASEELGEKKTEGTPKNYIQEKEKRGTAGGLLPKDSACQ